MLYSGSTIDQLDFCLPGETCFTMGSGIHRVFSPDGGGVIMPQLPAEAIQQVDTNPAPGWYMGAFNNVEWTPLGPDGPVGCPDLPAGSCPTGCPAQCPLPYQDVILVAHQISQPVCAKINELITGVTDSTAIPQVTGGLAKYLISATDPDGNTRHTNGNADFTKAVCPGCDGHPSLCVSDSAPPYTSTSMFSFYNVIEQR